MEEYLSPQEVAQRLRVKATTVRRWTASGILEVDAIKQGKRTRYRIKRQVIEAIEQRGKHHVLV